MTVLVPAEDELRETMSLTNQLEVLRKEKGERWLAIFNDSRSRNSGADEVGRQGQWGRDLKEERGRGRGERGEGTMKASTCSVYSCAGLTNLAGANVLIDFIISTM